MNAVMSIDARSGREVEQVATESTAADVDTQCERAAAAFAAWSSTPRHGRAVALAAVATRLEAHIDDIVAVADRETALGETRLRGELARVAFQLRLFGAVVEDGGYLEATIDHAGDTAMGPRPDLRRMLVPIGPVAVFGASNFPLAFSVPGGDTASALATGCPVVVKAHPSHPATSQLCFDLTEAALREAGAPPGAFGIVHGRDAGAMLVTHPAIRAVGFTGSLRGGRALHDLAAARPDPIPFYGELGSINPLVVCPAAAAQRGDAIARGLADSITAGAGQFCTKPGLVFVPTGAPGDSLRDLLAQELRNRTTLVLLDAGIRDAFVQRAARLTAHDSARALAGSEGNADADADAAQRGIEVGAILLEVDVRQLDADLTQECFGPFAIVVRYSHVTDLHAALLRVPSSLAATVQCDDADLEIARGLEVLLRQRAGRLVWNGYPTGVAVAWAMQHGGPWPATTSIHTSVGATAVRRFLRPVAWQSAPYPLLPAELRDNTDVFPSVPTRVDGELRLPIRP